INRQRAYTINSIGDRIEIAQRREILCVKRVLIEHDRLLTQPLPFEDPPCPTCQCAIAVNRVRAALQNAAGQRNERKAEDDDDPSREIKRQKLERKQACSVRDAVSDEAGRERPDGEPEKRKARKRMADELQSR